MKTNFKPVVSELKPGEKIIRHEEAIENGLLEDVRSVWVVSGQYVYNDFDPDTYPDAMTSVARAAMETGKYIVHTHLGRSSIAFGLSKKELCKKYPELFEINYYTKKELHEKFPELFCLDGQLLIQ